MTDVWSGHLLLPDGRLIKGMMHCLHVPTIANTVQKSASLRKMAPRRQSSAPLACAS